MARFEENRAAGLISERVTLDNRVTRDLRLVLDRKR